MEEAELIHEISVARQAIADQVEAIKRQELYIQKLKHIEAPTEQAAAMLERMYRVLEDKRTHLYRLEQALSSHRA